MAEADQATKPVGTKQEVEAAIVGDNVPKLTATGLNAVGVVEMTFASKRLYAGSRLSGEYFAAECGSVEVLRWLVQEGVDLSGKCGIAGRSILHCASAGGHAACVKWLLEAGADVHATMSCKRTALHEASRYDYADVVDVLIAAGVDVNASTVERESALHVAAWHGHVAIARALAKAGAKLDHVSSSWWTPLHMACKAGQAGVVVELLEAGANPNSMGEEGETPLHLACQYGNLEVVQAMIKGGAKADIVADFEHLPVNAAAAYCHAGTVQWLLEGSDLPHSPSYLTYATRQRDPAALSLLMAHSEGQPISGAWWKALLRLVAKKENDSVLRAIQTRKAWGEGGAGRLADVARAAREVGSGDLADRLMRAYRWEVWRRAVVMQRVRLRAP